MVTKQECTPLQTLRDHLQQTLNNDLPYGLAFRVQCLLKQETLMVLAQHGSNLKPDAPQVFQRLEQEIDRYRPRISSKGRLFLRVAGEKQPYLSHQFTIADRSILEPVSEQTPVMLPQASPARSFPWGWAIAAMLLLMVGGAAVYMATRPCAIAYCIPLETAQRLRQVAVQKAETTNNPQSLIEAQQQLEEAMLTAKTIPFWSPHFQSAQEFLYSNELHQRNLNHMVTAFSQGTEAAQLSLNPPHPLETWQEVESLWQQAVQSLEQVSQINTNYPLVKPKLKEYKQNRQAIQNRIVVEKQAHQDLQTAKSTADLAKTRQGIAQSVENWQQVYATWNSAVNLLKTIPESTQAQVEADQFLEVYETQFQASRERVLKEEIASETYNQALRLADRAKELERDNQLALAVGHWSQALSYLQQVPSDSFYYSKASGLVASYQESLKGSEQKLAQENKLEQARNDLNQTCSGSPTICDYMVSQNLLKVTLTEEYVKTVRKTLIQARGNGDLRTFSSMDEHVQSVQNALENISQTTRIPLELYDPDGKIMGTYVP